MSRERNQSIALLFALLALLLSWAAYATEKTKSIDTHLGDVRIDVWWGAGLVAAIDEDGDGTHERFYLLQFADLLPSEIPLSIPSAVVHVTAETLVVAGTDTVVTFAHQIVADIEPLVGRARRFVEVDPGAQRFDYRGHGLARHHASWPPPIAHAVGRDPEPFCQSGGQGSTSCSQSCIGGVSCNVTCPGGAHYACCGCERVEHSVQFVAMCMCLPNGGGGGSGGGNGGSGGGTCDVASGDWCPPACVSCTSAY